MTLEETKKKIKAQAEAEWEEFKKTGSMLCQGFALGADDALETLDKVESSGNPEQLTLTELANELRKIFKFKYLACEFYGGSKFYVISLWNGEPRWRGGSWWWCDNCDLIADIKLHMKFVEPNLSEYTDADGILDYSKCIVEVE